MKKYIFILLLLASNFTFSQVTEGQVLQEAKARNITNRNQAMDAMKANGISEAQARQMARKQGINYDDFLNSNFPKKQFGLCFFLPKIICLFFISGTFLSKSDFTNMASI